jgi:hypothetical protein
MSDELFSLPPPPPFARQETGCCTRKRLYADEGGEEEETKEPKKKLSRLGSNEEGDDIDYKADKTIAGLYVDFICTLSEEEDEVNVRKLWASTRYEYDWTPLCYINAYLRVYQMKLQQATARRVLATMTDRV